MNRFYIFQTAMKITVLPQKLKLVLESARNEHVTSAAQKSSSVRARGESERCRREVDGVYCKLPRWRQRPARAQHT